MICVSRQAAVMRRHVGAVLAVVAIHVDWLGTGRVMALAVGDRAERGEQEKQDTVFRAHGLLYFWGTSTMLHLSNRGVKRMTQSSGCEVSSTSKECRNAAQLVTEELFEI